MRYSSQLRPRGLKRLDKLAERRGSRDGVYGRPQHLMTDLRGEAIATLGDEDDLGPVKDLAGAQLRPDYSS